ncbi:MAG: 50S ribosome-binding GTPase [Planctomycetota bacterium]|nr:50S ribosome-binding GTPase [Planctomycetota bacterium]MDA1158905.1 50S ribosome-binding GTPase [Planctomycetota bacterium]
MPVSFSQCAQAVMHLHELLGQLEQLAASLQLDPLEKQEWFQLLEQKLLPQLADDAFLVAAVVGGTNIGKSVLFNHLAGSRASATSPLASGTKHVTCLTPSGFEDSHDLSSIFPGFELRQWSDSEQALQESEADWLFWRSSDLLPPNLLVLDTPDIDSDARVNWERADKIRRTADVLIAVLTQQKYNDAAVKEFFRRAAAEDKFVLVVFNQVHLPDDESYWPLWMKTFCDETGVDPQFLYLAPHDRQAAESNRLEFFERRWPATLSGDEAIEGAGQKAGRRLHEDLSSLKFGEIKLQTLQSALDLISAPEGIPGYLGRVKQRSDEFRSAAELLSTHKLAEIDNWPMLRNGLIVEKIRFWWQGQREGWSAKVHSFYNRIGSGITAGWRLVDEQLRGPQTPPLEAYRAREWEAVLDAVDEVYSRLNWFKELGNPLLQPRLEALLGATTRQELLDEIRAEHEAVDLDGQLQQLVRSELDGFRDESPEWYRSLRQLDAVAAAARPAVSIALFVTGFGPVGNAFGHLATETMVTSAVSVAGDVAAGGVTAAVGETWISSTASSGAAWLEARFRRIHEQFISKRAEWLANLLQKHLLGSLPEELAAAAMISESETFKEIERLVNELRQEQGMVPAELSVIEEESGERSAPQEAS